MGHKTTNKHKKKRTLKRKSRKRILYGGNDTLYNLPPPIEENNDISVIEKVPTFGENLSNLSNLVKSAAAKVSYNAIQKVGNSIGIDPNKSANENMNKLTNTVKAVRNVLESPKGEKLKKEASELFETTVDTIKPGLNKVVNIGNEVLEKEIPIAGNMLNEVLLATPVVGQAAAAAEEVGNVAQAVENASEGVADVISTSAETKKDLEVPMEKASNLLDDLKQMVNNVATGANKMGSNIINSVKTRVDKMPLEDSLNSYNKEKMLIGGRISKSQSEFLSPNVTRTKIMSQYGGKHKTRRINKYKR